MNITDFNVGDQVISVGKDGKLATIDVPGAKVGLVRSIKGGKVGVIWLGYGGHVVRFYSPNILETI